VGVSWHGIGPGVYNNAFVECTSGCPVSTATAPTVGFPNHTPGQGFWDLNLAYKVLNDTSEVYLVVQNVFDTQPPAIAASTNNGYYSGQGNSEFDRIGRVFRAGVRFKY
jgi:outer membrane receptor protein involved in Fe transport